MSARRKRTRSQARTSCLLVFLVLLMGAGPRVAVAESAEAQQQARRLFEAAEAHFRNGLFAEALAEYQSGYEISPLPGFLINIAQCQRRMGNLSVARATYRKFIMVAPDSPFVPQVEALIADLDSLTQDLAGATAASEAKAEGARSKAETSSSGEAGPSSPAGEQPAGVAVAVPPASDAQPQAKTRWWLWGGIGAAVVGAITVAVLVSRSPGNTTVHDGSLGTLRR